MLATRKTDQITTSALIGANLFLSGITVLGGWLLLTDRLAYTISSENNNGFNEENNAAASLLSFSTDDTATSTKDEGSAGEGLVQYIEITDGCGPHFEGECLNVRSGPGTDHPVVAQLRNDIVLKVGEKVTRDGETWFEIVFDEWLRYPERVTDDWYVSAEYVQVLLDEGEKTLDDEQESTSTAKEIIVDREEQKLYAYDNGELFMETDISTGNELTPTPQGTFTVFKKTPSRYMQGPLPGFPADDDYDLPGVPWNLYFTHGGAVIHGAYWHTSFGSRYSHGCVNLPPDLARELYDWAEVGTKVIVRG